MSYRRTSRGMGANAQLPATQYTGPVGGYACNEAGGYHLVTPKGYMTPQCMTAADLAAANASYDATPTGVLPTGPIGLQPNTSPGPGVPAGGGKVPTGGGAAAATSNVLDDALAWVKENPLLAAGLALGAFLLVRH